MPATQSPTLQYTKKASPSSSSSSSTGVGIVSTLQDHQRQTLTKFKDSLPELLSTKNTSASEHAVALEFLMSDTALYCYLQGNKWDLANAQKQWLESVVWRVHTFRPHLISFEDADIRSQAERKTNYVNGFDKEGRPIIYLKKKADKKELETAIKIMPEHIHQIVIIMDFTLYNQAQSTPIPIALETIRILTTHYPERLARAYLVNAPVSLRIFLKIVWPFLDEPTRNKIHFVSAPGKQKQEKNKENMQQDSKPIAVVDPLINDWISLDMLEITYGGTLDFDYEHQVYWKSVQELGIV
ncbi:4435_t:CDS:2 [Ambispora gerdemannii]|uniref:4435_t:CDS:1 n=1 Tax=Ambispora gerdemannii TaxID=144530 RepID=A0A9N9AI57_9GLOM|nr:4435_t:CDS:2 [Ambispora gerdemannii]